MNRRILSYLPKPSAPRRAGAGARAGIQIAAALMLIITGWVGRGMFDERRGSPAIVTEADQAHDMFVASLRVPPAPGTVDYQQLARRIDLAVPTLPATWRIVSAAIVPTGEGPALAISATTASGIPLTLFAVHDTRGAASEPIISSGDDELIASWKRGKSAYALAADTSRASLSSFAEQVYQDSPVG